MPKFQIEVTRTTRIVEVGYLWVEANSLEEAQEHADIADDPEKMKEVKSDILDFDSTVQELTEIEWKAHEVEGIIFEPSSVTIEEG
jgi:hypothetical protein